MAVAALQRPIFVKAEKCLKMPATYAKAQQREKEALAQVVRGGLSAVFTPHPADHI